MGRSGNGSEEEKRGWRHERDAKRALGEREERGRETDRQKEKRRPLVSSFLLVIGFSDWSKLFFSILLVSLSAAPFFPPSMA